MELSSRPLTGQRDHQFYVERPIDKRLATAIDDECNVLLRVVRGAGTTSLLNQLETTESDAVSINAASAKTADEILLAIIARVQMPQRLENPFVAFMRRADPLSDPRILVELRRWLEEQDRRLVVLVDGPADPRLAHELFGRHRDALFAVPATWIVTAHDDRTGEYLTPPADVFFDEVEQIEPLDTPTAEEILDRRGVFEILSRDDVPQLLRASDDTPRGLLNLARRRVRDQDQGTEFDLQRQAEAQAKLSREASMLLAELQGRGPVAATDRVLRERLGVHDRALRRRFAELEEYKLVERVPSGRHGPGRPPITFALTSLGDMLSPGTRIA